MSKIHILGASGSGTTTTGEALANKLGYIHLDKDDYFWEKTEIPYTQKRKVNERIKLLKKDLINNSNLVLSGIFYPWGDELTTYFDTMVYIEVDKKIRRKRLIEREYNTYGSKMLKNGDMYIQFGNFLNWAMNYEENSNEDIGKNKTENWLKKSGKKIIRVNGELPTDKIVQIIINEI